jgi:hypothetical protein
MEHIKPNIYVTFTLLEKLSVPLISKIKTYLCGDGIWTLYIVQRVKY